MAKTKWPPFEIQTGYFRTSLDCYGIKNILFMTLFFLKQSKLATIRNPDTFVGISNGPVLRCPVLA
jgi:hypothetical protein